jgi:LysM repeat protein
MKNRWSLLVLFFLLMTANKLVAQKNEVVQNYIQQYKELAIAEMQRTGVPAAIKLAQGIHETSAGTSNLVLKSNNHFGIKCKSNWTGESVSHDDDARGECFRKYPAAIDSYKDHSDFLKNSQRYASLFALDPTDYEGWANGLKKAGYATNPKYPLVLIKLIEDYHLQDYTLIALGKMQPGETGLVQAKNKEEIEEKATPVKEIKGQATAAVFKPAVDYPSGEFKINDTKVVYAVKGTSYLSIAKANNISLGRLFEFNEMDETETVLADQLIYLQRKRKTGKDEYHIVQPGETLRDIAQEQAIRLEALLEYNGLREGQHPAIGEKLYLRGKSGMMPKLTLKENYSIAPPSAKGIIN